MYILVLGALKQAQIEVGENEEENEKNMSENLSRENIALFADKIATVNNVKLLKKIVEYMDEGNAITFSKI